ncbi:MAG: Sec-independent protein translocase subunit TatA/TatB [Myxococcota bacterium]
MFGIGPGEMMILLVVLLIVVGPKSMPKLMQALGRGLREFRRATNELRQQVGFDELMQQEEWRDPLGLRRPAGTRRAAPSRQRPLTPRDRQREYPTEGVDVRHAAEREAPGADAAEQEAAEQEAADQDAGEGAP